MLAQERDEGAKIKARVGRFRGSLQATRHQSATRRNRLPASESPEAWKRAVAAGDPHPLGGIGGLRGLLEPLPEFGQADALSREFRQLPVKFNRPVSRGTLSLGGGFWTLKLLA